MSQIKGFIRDGLAYMLASTKLGFRITGLSDEMERLRNTEFSVKSITVSAPCDENAPMRGGRDIELARKMLKKSKDPRYISNPFYKPSKHNRANGHYLFDELKKSELEQQSPYKFLHEETVVVIDGQEFKLLESTKAVPHAAKQEDNAD